MSENHSAKSKYTMHSVPCVPNVYMENNIHPIIHRCIDNITTVNRNATLFTGKARDRIQQLMLMHKLYLCAPLNKGFCQSIEYIMIHIADRSVSIVKDFLMICFAF